jgi:DNA (cytosine-5)-methyltransferase 1
MRHGSLFSGIGGFDLASEWMGWENVFHCEWNPFGQKVLNYYWPNAITYYDITKTDFTIHRGRIDIITGGFPCQPYSSAGKRLGKEDERHLWPEMLRAIREIQPTWVVGENVRGLTNWNGGLVFDEVQAELEAQGYQVTPFLLPACAVNAPHRRDRIWFIAYSKINRQSQSKGIDKWEEHKQDNRDRIRSSFDTNGSIGTSSNSISFRQSREKHREKESEWIAKNGEKSNTSDSEFKGLQGCADTRKVSGKKGTLGGEGDKLTAEFASINQESNDTNPNCIGQIREWEQGIIDKQRKGRKKRFRKLGNNEFSRWEKFPTVSPICDGDDGISDRLDSITFSKWRNESIKAGGNAVVPQVVYQIFKAIKKYNELDKQLTI